MIGLAVMELFQNICGSLYNIRVNTRYLTTFYLSTLWVYIAHIFLEQFVFISSVPVIQMEETRRISLPVVVKTSGTLLYKFYIDTRTKQQIQCNKTKTFVGNIIHAFVKGCIEYRATRTFKLIYSIVFVILKMEIIKNQYIKPR